MDFDALGGALDALIRQAVRTHLPGREVAAIRDRGMWVRRIIEVTLDDGNVVFFKISVPHDEPGWLEGGERGEQDVAELLAPRGIAVVPSILAMDATGEILPHPYVIQTKVGGTRLATLLERDPSEGPAIYAAIGRLYAEIHAVHSERDGLWSGTSPDQPWGSPTDHMYRAEIVEGSGRRALEAGRISSRTYERAVDLWATNLDYLKDHQPSLVHVSAFPWTLYLDREGDHWRIIKLTSVGDFLWWDPAYDVACLRYPPFGKMVPAWWAGFLEGYGEAPERKRLLLYAVMQRLCASMGVYMAPQTPQNETWAANALDDLDTLLDEIAAMTR